MKQHFTHLGLSFISSHITRRKAQGASQISGIVNELTQAGGINPGAFIVELYATAGARICPPMWHGEANGKVFGAAGLMPIICLYQTGKRP